MYIYNNVGFNKLKYNDCSMTIGLVVESTMISKIRVYVALHTNYWLTFLKYEW